MKNVVKSFTIFAGYQDSYFCRRLGFRSDGHLDPNIIISRFNGF